jgi:IS30 family transposase
MVTSRIWFTAAQKAELWERWKNGQSAAAISRALERKNKTGVERIVVFHPAPRRRALAALRFDEREEISRGIPVGRSVRQIAQGLGRAPSTVSREIRRNAGSQAYRAYWADRRARERALRPKPCRLALNSELRWRVAQKLALQWSPQQISGWLKQEFPTHQDMQISHEAIYRSLFIQTRGVLKKELTAQLCTARRMRHSKSHNEGARSETRGGRRLGRQAAPQMVVFGEHADERLVRRRNQRPALCGRSQLLQGRSVEPGRHACLCHALRRQQSA